MRTNWVQDIYVNSVPNPFIVLDAYFNFNSKLLNATRNDIGIGNINVATANSIYNKYKSTFDNKNWNYSDIINYISSNEGTVHLATLVIKQAQELLKAEVKGYPDDMKEAVYVTYYKQGDSYIERFNLNKKRNKNSKIKPGEGCRVAGQRQAILNVLYKLN